MEFYKKIAEYYDQIFSPNKITVDFFSSLLNEGQRILDAGCATGEYARLLARNNFKVTAIDLDENLIRKAKEKDLSGAEFFVMDILQLATNFKDQYFDLIFCIGNTLVHLPSEDAIKSFLQQAADRLSDKGKLVIQIVNYDRILKERIKELPVIENEVIKFSRYYDWTSEDNLVFKSVLQIKEDNQIIEGEVVLKPVYKEHLSQWFREAGFLNVKYFGDFKLNNWSLESAATIGIAENK